ncbi:hypothetical protein PR048_014345 [Dryococelus australis]|uniref:Uncharacterized protein n=1 Tax=Dryococelus australis TaxID=614101 RepID=A0ABQ9HE50_9NEOP|nr:hypothetical protein PR048_014345 [Dryococelus australis]
MCNTDQELLLGDNRQQSLAACRWGRYSPASRNAVRVAYQLVSVSVLAGQTPAIHTNKAPTHEELFLAFEVEQRGSDKDDAATLLKCAISTKHKARNWQAAWLCYLYVWDFEHTLTMWETCQCCRIVDGPVEHENAFSSKQLPMVRYELLLSAYSNEV